MAADKDLLKAKYKDIRLEFKKFCDKTYNGVRIYTDSYILLKLSEKFYLAPKTIENIVYYRTDFQKNLSSSSQTNLFGS